MVDNYRPPTAPDQPQAAPTPYKAPSKSKRYRPPTAPDQPQVVTTPTEKKKVVEDYRPPVAPGEVPQVITRPTAPREVTAISMKDFGAVDERLTQQAQRLAAERERAATGAVLVAEARARKPTEPVTYMGPEYIPSPYKPGTRPEDVKYGERPTFEQPQITDIHEVIGDIIDVSAGKFKSGLGLVEGKDVDIDVTKVEEPDEYVTRNIHDFITGKTEEYRMSLESAETQQAIRTGIYKGRFEPAIPEAYEKWAPERLITGVLRAPASAVDILAMLPVGAEHMIRTKGEVYKDFPLAAGVMVGGMKQEAVSDPLAFIGEAVTLPLISKTLPAFKSQPIPKTKTIPSYDPIGFPAEFGRGKPVTKYIKKIPEDLKTFLGAEEAAVELKILRKKKKIDLDAKLKEKWAKREKELETLAKEGGYTVTKEGQVLISKVKQEPKVVSLIKDPWLEQFKMKPEEIVSTKMKVYPKVVAGKKVDVYIAKPKEVVKVFEPLKKEVSPQKLFERTQVVQSLKELQRLKALQEPVSVVKAKPAVKAKAQTRSLQERRSALVVLLKTAETQTQKEELKSIITSIDVHISSVSSTAATIPAPIPPIPTPSQYIITPIPTVDEIPAPPPPKSYKYVPPPTPILEEIPPMPKIIPILKPKEAKKPVGFIRKDIPGYAWQLANPIASLEQLLGGHTAPRSTRTAPRSKRTKKTTKRK